MTVIRGEQNTDLLECKASCPGTPDVILTGVRFKNTKGQDILSLINTDTYSHIFNNNCSNGARHAYYQLNMTWNTTGVFYIQCVVEYDNMTVSSMGEQTTYPCWTGITTITVIDQNG